MERKKKKIVLLSVYWSKEVSMMVKGSELPESSFWIQECINLFKNKEDVEFFVVAPNYGRNKTQRFYQDSIHYVFFKYGLDFIAYILYYFYNLLCKRKITILKCRLFVNVFTRFFYPKNAIKRIVKEINPDLVYLRGSDDPDVSVGAVSLLGKFPILTHIRGYTCLEKLDLNFYGRKLHAIMVKHERILNMKSTAIMVHNTKTFLELFGNRSNLFTSIPMTRFPEITTCSFEKRWDIVYYARVTKMKGIEDLLASIALLFKENICLKTLIIGHCEEKYLIQLKEKIDTYGIGEFIFFKGFIKDIHDVHLLACQSKVLVLPTYNDGFNNTIREAMCMRLPVIANNVGGIPIANLHNECITLTKVGDIDDLASKIKQVLNDEERTKRLVENSYNEMMTYYHPKYIYGFLLDIFDKVIM